MIPNQFITVNLLLLFFVGPFKVNYPSQANFKPENTLVSTNLSGSPPLTHWALSFTSQAKSSLWSRKRGKRLPAALTLALDSLTGKAAHC